MLTELTSGSPWAPHTHHGLERQLLYSLVASPRGKEMIRCVISLFGPQWPTLYVGQPFLSPIQPSIL